VVDGHGTIYVSDYGNECIRKVTPSNWTVSTLCGVGTHAGFADGAAAAARFHSPRRLAMDMDSNLIVADCDNHCIRKVVPLDACQRRQAAEAQAKASQTARPLPHASTSHMT